MQDSDQLAARVKAIGGALSHVWHAFDHVEFAADNESAYFVLEELRRFVRECDKLVVAASALRDDLGRGAEITKGK